jgi:hypothetical protein
MSKQSFVILTQTLHDKDASGKRYPHGAIKRGKYRAWERFTKTELNFKQAVNFITNQLNTYHVGGLVLIKKLDSGDITTLYQAKWGHNNLPYTNYEYSIGNYWRNKAKLP